MLLVVCVLGFVLVFGVLVDDVECVLSALLGVEYGAGEDLGGSGEVIQRARRKSDSKQSYEKNELSERFLNVRQPLTFSLRAMGVRDRV